MPQEDTSSSSLSLSSSDSDSDSEENAKPAAPAKPAKKKPAKKGDLSFEDLAKHGYSSGPSVLHVPAPRRNANLGDPDWSWSSGKRKTDGEQGEESESIEERERTREITNAGAEKLCADAIAEFQHTKKQRRDAAAEQRALSFSKKEKRKRDLGQASRGKSYVEEEKRLLRDRGVYSGFD